MSCPDSQILRKDTSFASGDMGDVLGKESDDAEGDEVSQEYGDCSVELKNINVVPSSDETETDVNHDAVSIDPNYKVLY